MLYAALCETMVRQSLRQLLKKLSPSSNVQRQQQLRRIRSARPGTSRAKSAAASAAHQLHPPQLRSRSALISAVKWHDCHISPCVHWLFVIRVLRVISLATL